MYTSINPKTNGICVNLESCDENSLIEALHALKYLAHDSRISGLSLAIPAVPKTALELQEYTNFLIDLREYLKLDRYKRLCFHLTTPDHTLIADIY